MKGEHIIANSSLFLQNLKIKDCFYNLLTLSFEIILYITNIVFLHRLFAIRISNLNASQILMVFSVRIIETELSHEKLSE